MAYTDQIPFQKKEELHLEARQQLKGKHQIFTGRAKAPSGCQRAAPFEFASVWSQHSSLVDLSLLKAARHGFDFNSGGLGVFHLSIFFWRAWNMSVSFLPSRPKTNEVALAGLSCSSAKTKRSQVVLGVGKQT